MAAQTPVDAVVIGIDGGGTYTRALCADLEGRVLAFAQTGGAHPRKNAIAEENVRAAIGQILDRAGREPGQVVGVVAQERLVRTLSQKMGKYYTVVEPALSLVAGAVPLALKRQGVTLDEELIETLRDYLTVWRMTPKAGE
jgi:hypothetical protein